MRLIRFSILSALICVTLHLSAQDIYIPTLDAIPAHYTINHRFKLSTYPKSVQPQASSYPWSNINFKSPSESENYLKTVLNYFLEENSSNDFQIPASQKRKWYHAPAMNLDPESGREFFRGLTRERDSRPRELHPKQDEWVQNWAIGFYNNVGAHEIERIWSNPPTSLGKEKANFKNGAVSAKLLFTSDPKNQIDYLDSTLTWVANIHEKANGLRSRNSRKPQTVKLLQVDLAIKDKNSPTGWVFGTFVYHKDYNPKKSNWYEHLLCVGISWDSNTSSQWINPVFIKYRNEFKNEITWRLGGGNNSLVNGPIDNSNSSCISCHKSAEGTKNNSMDYSQQLDYGISDFKTPEESKKKRQFFFHSNNNGRSSLIDEKWTNWTLIAIASCFGLTLALVMLKNKQ